MHYGYLALGVAVGLGVSYVIYRYGRSVEQKAQQLARKL